MLRFTVLAEPFAVIGDDDDDHRTGDVLLERLREPAELLVHRSDLAEIRMLAVRVRYGSGGS